MDHFKISYVPPTAFTITPSTTKSPSYTHKATNKYTRPYFAEHS